MRQTFRVLLLAASFSFVAHAEKANVVFVHGANVSEQEGQVWAKEMFKRLWQAGANMEFHPVAWESDIGPSYNYRQTTRIWRTRGPGEGAGGAH